LVLPSPSQHLPRTRSSSGSAPAAAPHRRRADICTILQRPSVYRGFTSHIFRRAFGVSAENYDRRPAGAGFRLSAPRRRLSARHAFQLLDRAGGYGASRRAPAVPCLPYLLATCRYLLHTIQCTRSCRPVARSSRDGTDREGGPGDAVVYSSAQIKNQAGSGGHSEQRLASSEQRSTTVSISSSTCKVAMYTQQARNLPLLNIRPRKEQREGKRKLIEVVVRSPNRSTI